MPLKTPSHITALPPLPARPPSTPGPSHPCLLSYSRMLISPTVLIKATPSRMTLKEAKEASPGFRENFPGNYFGLMSAGPQGPSNSREEMRFIVEQSPTTCWSVGTQGLPAPKAVGSQFCPYLLVTLGTPTQPTLPKFIPSDNYTLTSGRAGLKPDCLGSDPTSTSY